ncbi:hypothetical protein LZ554_004690 [Drepanopeziza brunnea f. sp. 'monogermtubi']|nr:hypothetical protein LZ554_004690 [Drepanopeziza brunnea f. sp. 'monogermtubi']
MNWATLDPATRLYKGKNIYKWGDSPGLEHHCGVCAIPLHNSRAKTSCIGKHVEPCYRFHQQLHFVGKSHECFGCNSSDELHHSRHKEILKIIREIATLDHTATVLPPDKSTGLKARRSSTSTCTTTTSSNLTDTASEVVSVDGTIQVKITRRERKKAKKAGNGNARDRKYVEAFPKDETDFVSEAIHLTVHESKGAWHGTYVYDHKKPVIEESAGVDDNEEIEYTEESMTMEFESLAVQSPGIPSKSYTAPLKDLTPRQRKNVLKTTTALKYQCKGSSSRKYATQLNAEMLDPFSGLDPQIFFRLGIDVDPSKSSKSRKDLVAKLVAAVKEDMTIIEREESETEMRAEGFRRWAGRQAYAAILRIREHLDWATGQKITVPTFEDFPDDEIDLDGSELAEQESPTQELELKTTTPKPKAKTAWPAGSKKLDDDDGFTVASRKKVSGKKVQGGKKFTKMSVSTNRIAALDIDEEEETGGDVHEMVRRYEQRRAGERNLGGLHTGSTPDRRTVGGRTLIIR